MGGGHGLPAQLPQCPGRGVRAGVDERAKQDQHGCCSGLARAGRYRERSPSSGLLRGPLSYLSRPGEQCPPPPLKKQCVGSERSLPSLPAHLQVLSSMVTGRAAPARGPLSLSLLTTCSAAPGLREGTQAERKTVRKKNPNQTHTAGSWLGCESCLWLRHGWGSVPVQDGAGHGLRTPAWRATATAQVQSPFSLGAALRLSWAFSSPAAATPRSSLLYLSSSSLYSWV